MSGRSGPPCPWPCCVSCPSDHIVSLLLPHGTVRRLGEAEDCRVTRPGEPPSLRGGARPRESARREAARRCCRLQRARPYRGFLAVDLTNADQVALQTTFLRGTYVPSESLKQVRARNTELGSPYAASPLTP